MGLSKAYLIYKKYTLSIGIVIFISLLICCTNVLEEDPICIDGCINFELIDYEPSWSPDGKWIAYYHVDSRTDYTGIYRIRPDGSENTFWIPGGQNPAWSPDSKWLAYSLGAQIWITELEGDRSEQLTFEGRNFFPDWSPVESKLVYHQTVCSGLPCGIWMKELGKPSEFIIPYGMDANFHSSQMLFIYRKKWVENNGNVLGDSLFHYNVTSKVNKFITTLNSPEFLSNGNFKFNKSNDSFLFSSIISHPLSSNIFLKKKDNEKPQILILNAHSADWSPDSSKIVYTNSNVGNGRLHILDLVSNQSFQLTFENQFLTP
jgi:TolB protein